MLFIIFDQRVLLLMTDMFLFGGSNYTKVNDWRAFYFHER